MADPQAGTQLYTLTQVSEQTGISMPTLQRYKKLYQNRIPSKGSGRSQRYPEEALEIFRGLKKENIGRRGRPRKTGSSSGSAREAAARATSAPAKMKGKVAAAPARPTKKTAAAAADGLLTLTQIGKLTGISYPTLLRYVKTNIKQIPHKGSGRARRFLPDSVDIFKRLRGESRRGRLSKAAKAGKATAPAARAKAGRPSDRGPHPKRPAAAVATAPVPANLLDRIKELEKSNRDLRKSLAKLEQEIKKPYRIVLNR